MKTIVSIRFFVVLSVLPPSLAGQTPASIEVASLLGNNLVLEWSNDGAVYQVQRRSSLGRPGWTDLRGCLTTETTATVPLEGTAGFFRVVDLSSGQMTVFSGGTLDDLRAISPTLTFDHLIINGALNLSLAATASLQVNHLTLTAHGSIGYDHGPCEHGPAPSVIIRATGSVSLGGQIYLKGESGTRVTGGATCNSCYGRDGGDLDIEASEIAVTGSINTGGGAGGTSVSDSGDSSGCSAGNGGTIRLVADRLSIAQTTIETAGGRGGIGFFMGVENHGSDGQPGEIHFICSGSLRIQESEIKTDGTAIVQAAEADVASPIVSGDLQLSIGGAADQTPPNLEILYPHDGAYLPINAPLRILIEAHDPGSGIKELQVTGLGHDALHSATEMIDGILTVVIEKPSPPGRLTVTVRDNLGNQQTQSVSDLRLTGNLTIPQNTEYVLSGDLDLGTTANLIVEGRLAIAKGVQAFIRAGSFIVTETGQVLAEEPASELELAQAPGLEIELQGTAEINGLIELSGHPSLPGRDYDYGQPGGNFTLNAASINVTGAIHVNGGRGESYEYGWPAVTIRQGGARAGSLRLTAADTIQVTGSLTARGGDTGYGGTGPCFAGGDGGSILLTFGSTADIADALSLSIRGGTNVSSGSCPSTPGQSGQLVTLKTSATPLVPSDYLAVDEVEPNGAPASPAASSFPVEWVPGAAYAFGPVQITGSLTDPDPGSLCYPYDDSHCEDISDLYALSIPVQLRLNAELDWATDADLDLLIFKTDTFELAASGLTTDKPESLVDVTLEPGDYLLGVVPYDRGAATELPYTIRLVPLALP